MILDLLTDLPKSVGELGGVYAEVEIAAFMDPGGIELQVQVIDGRPQYRDLFTNAGETA